MNKFLLTIMLSITSLLLFLLSCSNRNADNIDKNEIEKKQTFLKVINFVKNNNVDSIKKYVLNIGGENKTYNFNIAEYSSTITAADNKNIELDSINVRDSIFTKNNLLLYDYALRFYNKTHYVGTVVMSFYGNENNSVVNLFAEKNNDGIDTTGLMDEIRGH